MMHLVALFGTIGTTILSEVLKLGFIKKLSPRPDGAKNCNLMCNDGIQSGQPGMPSSHSAQVSFFTGFYLQYSTNIYVKIALAIYALFVMVSRYIKKCHTIKEIIVGSRFGFGLSYLLMAQIVRHL
jgi:membrane-associated phospholipid phosphatase